MDVHERVEAHGTNYGRKQAHLALQRALLAGLQPAEVTIESDSQSSWQSATFSGSRHHFDMTVSGDGAIIAAARLSTLINADEVMIAGHLVADIQLSSHQLIQWAQRPVVVIGVDALTVRAV
jgi:hypothetical protein